MREFLIYDLFCFITVNGFYCCAVFTGCPITFGGCGLSLEFFVLVLVHAVPGLASGSVASVGAVAGSSAGAPYPAAVSFPVQQIIGNARVISICAGSSYGYLTGCHTVKMYIRARLCKVYILSGIRSAEMIVIIAHQLSGSRCLQWPYRLINTTIIDIAGGCFLIGVFILDRIFIGSDILWKRIHINPVFALILKVFVTVPL